MGGKQENGKAASRLPRRYSILSFPALFFFWQAGMSIDFSCRVPGLPAFTYERPSDLVKTAPKDVHLTWSSPKMTPLGGEEDDEGEW